jgi:hypothetical protein
MSRRGGGEEEEGEDDASSRSSSSRLTRRTWVWVCASFIVLYNIPLPKLQEELVLLVNYPQHALWEGLVLPFQPNKIILIIIALLT